MFIDTVNHSKLLEATKHHYSANAEIIIVCVRLLKVTKNTTSFSSLVIRSNANADKYVV